MPFKAQEKHCAFGLVTWTESLNTLQGPVVVQKSFLGLSVGVSSIGEVFAF